MVGIYIVIIEPFNPELNPICHLLALLGAHHILHFSRIRVNMERKIGVQVWNGWNLYCDY